MAHRHLAVLAALALLMLGPASPVNAQAQKQAGRAGSVSSAGAAVVDYAERFNTTCAACHGATGRSDIPGVPVIAGNSSLYVITQLFMFREGRRKNEAMTAMAKQMTDADLKGFSNYIGTLAAVPAPAPASPPDAARMTKAKALAEQHKCTYCHGADLAGGQQVPRIGGQKEDYLRQALHGYKSGDRPGYSRAMPEALSQVPVEDLDILAFYAANISGK
jgi:cytochrome c553